MLMDGQNTVASEDNLVADDKGQNSVDNNSITWSASEFIDNTKNFSWYLVFLVTILVISSLVYIFTHSIFSSIVIFILGVSLLFMATRRPKEVSYGLDEQGILINNTDHPFSDFKSYTLESEGGLDHISLVSVKRFSPDKTIYFESQDKDRIVSLLGQFLPLEPESNDPIERIMKRIGL